MHKGGNKTINLQGQHKVIFDETVSNFGLTATFRAKPVYINYRITIRF